MRLLVVFESAVRPDEFGSIAESESLPFEYEHAALNLILICTEALSRASILALDPFLSLLFVQDEVELVTFP